MLLNMLKACGVCLQADEPDDFVLATNETHSIREFVEETFKVLGEEIIWKGKGLEETGILKSSGKVVVGIDPQVFQADRSGYSSWQSGKSI